MGFLSDYVGYLKTRTHAPPIFHLHSALVCLSQAIGTSYSARGYGVRPIYANLYVVEIAESGSGKSVPIDMCERMLRQAGLDTVLPASWSLEALYDALQSKPVSVFLPQEFAAFLAMANREYNNGATQFLTEMFDVQPEWKRYLRPDREGRAKSITLTNQYVSLLGASSPDWFVGAFKTTDLTGGFFARFIWSPCSVLGARVEEPGDFDYELEATLAGHLRAVHEHGLSVKSSDIHRPFVVDYGRVKAAFSRFDIDQERRIHRSPPEFRGMRSRATLMAKKAAMLFMASRDAGAVSIAPEDADRAFHYVTEAQNLAEEFLTNSVPRNKDDEERIRIRALLTANQGEMRWSDLLKRSHLDGRVFTKAIETMTEAGYVTLATVPTQTRPVRVVRLTTSTPTSSGSS